MEIWVHAVYVIVASINALLICSGLQSSIRIIHLHARTHARLASKLMLRKEKHRLADSKRNERLEKTSGRGDLSREDNKQPAAASLFVFSLSIVTVLICCTHHQIYIHTTQNNAESAKISVTAHSLEKLPGSIQIIIILSYLFVSACHAEW